MDHADHVSLLRKGIPRPGGVWADLGAGRGAFTLALAELIGPTGEIYALDQDAGALEVNARSMRSRFPDHNVQYEIGDYTEPHPLPPLDGIVMANTLHFQPNPVPVVQLCRRYLRPGGRLLLVEYNLNQPHGAVPYPVAYPRWQSIARDAGFEQTTLLARRPSRFLREIYAAASW